MHHPLSLVARGFSLIGELESQDSRRGLAAVSPSASPQIGPLSMSGARCSVSCSVTWKTFQMGSADPTKLLQGPLWRMKGTVLSVQPLQTASLLLFVWQLACRKTFEQKDPNTLKVWKSLTQTLPKFLYTQNGSTSVRWGWRLWRRSCWRVIKPLCVNRACGTWGTATVLAITAPSLPVDLTSQAWASYGLCNLNMKQLPEKWVLCLLNARNSIKMARLLYLVNIKSLYSVAACMRGCVYVNACTHAKALTEGHWT